MNAAWAACTLTCTQPLQARDRPGAALEVMLFHNQLHAVFAEVGEAFDGGEEGCEEPMAEDSADPATSHERAMPGIPTVQQRKQRRKQPPQRKSYAQQQVQQGKQQQEQQLVQVLQQQEAGDEAEGDLGEAEADVDEEDLHVQYFMTVNCEWVRHACILRCNTQGRVMHHCSMGTQHVSAACACASTRQG